MITESLAHGLYNKMSREVNEKIDNRFGQVNRGPAGRQRRGPWFRNRLKDLRRVYRDVLLFDYVTGEGKNLRAQLFILEISENRKPEVLCIEIRAKDFHLDIKPITLHVNRHAMARIIQSTRCAWFGEMRQCFSRVVLSALKIMVEQTQLLRPGMTLRVATEDGLFIWDVHEENCNSGVGLTLKTFIGEHVLDGHNKVIYDSLIDRDADDRYALTRKRRLNS